jgi:hypothetical protein
MPRAKRQKRNGGEATDGLCAVDAGKDALDSGDISVKDIAGILSSVRL